MNNTIWVDADACPRPIKEILFRASMRVEMPLVLVANSQLGTPTSTFIRTVQVAQGFDIADHYIVEHVQAGDLVITSDIPLASEVIQKEAYVIGFRGEHYDKNNIKSRLSARNFMENLRNSGVQTRGPDPLTQACRQKFSSELEKYLNS